MNSFHTKQSGPLGAVWVPCALRWTTTTTGLPKRLTSTMFLERMLKGFNVRQAAYSYSALHPGEKSEKKTHKMHQACNQDHWHHSDLHKKKGRLHHSGPFTTSAGRRLSAPLSKKSLRKLFHSHSHCSVHFKQAKEFLKQLYTSALIY